MTTAALPRKAFVQMFVGAALISTTSIFVKLAHVGPTVSAFYRMAFGGAILVVALIAMRQWRAVSKSDIGWLAFPALAFAIDLMVWHRSIVLVGPGVATLLGNFQVFVMALAGWLFYREQLGWRFIVGVALGFLGLFLLVGLDWSTVGAGYHLGVALGIVTGVAYAAYMLSTRHAQRSGHVRLAPAQLLAVHGLLCAAILAVAIVAERDSFSLPDAQSIVSLLGLALVGQVLGWVLIVRAMPQLPASLVGLLLLLQPVLSFVLDVILFARPTFATDWIGLVVSLLGIFIGSWRPSQKTAAASEIA